jgi:hypothetical protein
MTLLRSPVAERKGEVADENRELSEFMQLGQPASGTIEEQGGGGGGG